MSILLIVGVTLRVATGQQLQGYSVQLVQHQGSVKGNSFGLFYSFFHTYMLHLFLKS